MTVKKPTKSPYWHFDFWYHGRRYRGSTKETAKARAQDHESRLRWKIQHGEDPFLKSPLLSDLRANYLAWLETNRSRGTVNRSRECIDNVLARMKGVQVAADITAAKVEAYKKQRLSEGSPFTVSCEIRHFKAFLNRCLRQQWLAALPVELESVRVPRRGRVVFLQDDQIEAVLGNLPFWAQAVAEFLLQTGLRWSEGAYLEWQDLDLDAGNLWVHSKPAFGFVTKGQKERTVPMPTELVEQLKARQKKTGWVLESRNGGQLVYKVFRLALNRAGKAAGVPFNVGPHTLRHTYGSRLAMAGVPLPTIKELMGHSDISTTMIYVHLSADHKREAVARLTLPAREQGEPKVIPLRG